MRDTGAAFLVDILCCTVGATMVLLVIFLISAESEIAGDSSGSGKQQIKRGDVFVFLRGEVPEGMSLEVKTDWAPSLTESQHSRLEYGKRLAQLQLREFKAPQGRDVFVQLSGAPRKQQRALALLEEVAGRLKELEPRLTERGQAKTAVEAIHKRVRDTWKSIEQGSEFEAAIAALSSEVKSEAGRLADTPAEASVGLYILGELRDLDKVAQGETKPTDLHLFVTSEGETAYDAPLTLPDLLPKAPHTIAILHRDKGDASLTVKIP